MSQEKAQLIAPIGHFTVPGLNVTGVVTATSFSGNCTGTASSITKGASLVVGVMTATSFVGDVTGNVTGIGSNTDNLDVGIVTATSFAGNFTGIGSGLTGTPNVVAGVVTATKFVGNTPGTVSKLADGTNINVGVVTATKFVGNTSGLAGGISAAQNINVGVLTATGGLYGDGSGLTGAGSTAYIRQTVTASVSAAINLNLGNVIYFVHDANATVSFANTTTATDVTIIRTLTDNTITWPDSITWNGGSAPTLLGANSRATAGQVFNLVTYNGGTNWYGYEEVDADPQTFGLFAWGANGKGQLAQNSATYYSSPVQVPGTTWSTLAGGLSFNSSGAIKSDGTLWMWGDNGHGNLGLNDTIKRSSPTQIPSTTWSNVSAGGDNETSTIAIKTDGTMWAWGGNDQGNLGHNNRTDRSSPTQIPGTTWKDVSNGADWVVATKTDGTAWSWGKNSHGYLGLNNTTEKSSPTQIPGTTWAYAAAGRPGNNVAVKTDGTLWAWGHNGNGALGQNNTTNYASPKQIPGTSWDSSHPNKVNAGFYRAFAIKTDGTLWGWGANSNGELGNNNRTQYSSPVQIPGTNWESIDNMYSVTLATKTDGTLWSWGYNYGGVLGLNTSNPGANHSSPVQIPGSWKLGEDGIGRTIAAHQFSALALRVE